MDPRSAGQLERIESSLHMIERHLRRHTRMLVALGALEVEEMTIAQQLLDLAAKQGTTVQSILTLIQGLQASGQIDANTAAQILSVFQGNEDKLEAVLQPAPAPGA